MSDNQTTQPLSTPTDYRYITRAIGSRKGPLGWPTETEHGAECVDSWTGDVMSVHWAATPDLASLVAETQCAERNGPMVALTFASKLALYIDRAREVAAGDDHFEGDVLEDVERVLEWHIRHLRGVSQEALDVDLMRIPAPEFNR
jgi:hypothetical protein